MVPFPKKVVEAGLLKPAMKAINDLRDYVQTLTPRPGKGIKINHTNTGAVFDVDSVRAVAAASSLQWKGEWRTGVAYDEGDIVIRGSNNLDSSGVNDADDILSDGSKAGLYLALQAVPAASTVVGATLGPEEPKEPNEWVDPTDTTLGAYWVTLARFATHIFAVRQISGTQKLLIDASDPNGEVRMNLHDCNGKTLSFREVDVCVNGLPKKMMILGSVPY